MGKIGDGQWTNHISRKPTMDGVCKIVGTTWPLFKADLSWGEGQMLVVASGLEDPESRKGALVHPSEASAFSHVAHFKSLGVTCRMDPAGPFNCLYYGFTYYPSMISVLKFT